MEDSMKYSTVLYFSLVLLISIPLIATAQTDRDQRLHQIEGELAEIEHRLSEELHPDERAQLEQKFEELQGEKIELQQSSGIPIEPAEKNGHIFSNPIVIAAIIGALGAIIGALIGLKKRKT
jgi:hypothetical protein